MTEHETQKSLARQYAGMRYSTGQKTMSGEVHNRACEETVVLRKQGALQLVVSPHSNVLYPKSIHHALKSMEKCMYMYIRSS